MRLIILGMHRSGTSAMAGLFQQAGAYFGPSEQAFPVHDSNGKGFFERRDVVRINDRLLEAADANWIDPSSFPVIDPPVARALDLRREAETIMAEMDRHASWFLKDPRLCITLPFWRDLMTTPAVYLLVLRNPLDVALSLKKRGDCSLSAGLALWEFYTRQSFRLTQGVPRLAVWFEDLVASPHESVQKLFTSLAGLTDRPLTVPSSSVIDTWFDRSMVHHESSMSSLADHASERLMNLFRSLRKDPLSCSEIHEPPPDTVREILHEESAQYLRIQGERERARSWRNRLRRFAESSGSQAHDYRQQVEALLQSWRWRLPDSLLRKAGRAADKASAGFSVDALRKDGDELLATLWRDMQTASLPELMQPLPLYPQHNPDVRWTMKPRRILIIADTCWDDRSIRWLKAVTMLLTAYGHEVNWLTATDPTDVLESFDWPVHGYRLDTQPALSETMEQALDEMLSVHDVVFQVPDRTGAATSPAADQRRPLAAAIAKHRLPVLTYPPAGTWETSDGDFREAVFLPPSAFGSTEVVSADQLPTRRRALVAWNGFLQQLHELP